jgi:hypothetical protein
VAVAVGVRAYVDARPVAISGQEIVEASTLEQIVEGHEVELLESRDVNDVEDR